VSKRKMGSPFLEPCGTGSSVAREGLLRGLGKCRKEANILAKPIEKGKNTFSLLDAKRVYVRKGIEGK